MEEQQFITFMDTAIRIKIMILPKYDPVEFMLHICEVFSAGPELIPNVIEVKKSKISGRGVFATNEIKKGMVITLYPVHIITKNGVGAYLPNYEKEHLKYTPTIRDKYKFTIDSNWDIYGFPEIIKSPYIGHIINDSYDNVSELSNLKNINDVGMTLFRYLLKSKANSNCVFVKSKCKYYVYVKTTKDIQIGEELLASYGPIYWCKNLNDSEYSNMLKEYMLGSSMNLKQKTIMMKLIRGSVIQSQDF